MSETYEQITAEVRAQLPYARDDYEPVFHRDSTTRRVLGHVTDSEDGFASLVGGAVSRNTVQALAVAMLRDENTPEINGNAPGELTGEPSLEIAKAQVEAHLGQLEHVGFVEQREDGTYALTDAGQIELSN